MILVDTNIVSELMRAAPDDTVMAWAAEQGPSDLIVSVITVVEIERGFGRLRPGRRRDQIEARWVAIREQYAGSFVPVDLDAAANAAQTLVRREKLGHPMSLADAQIAGTATVRGASLATRNTRDFADVPGLHVINPFDRDTWGGLL